MAADPWWDAECRGSDWNGGSHRFFRFQRLGKVGFTGDLYGKIRWKIWVDYQMVEFCDHAIFTPSVRISSLDYMGIDGALITKILGTTINGGV